MIAWAARSSDSSSSDSDSALSSLSSSDPSFCCLFLFRFFLAFLAAFAAAQALDCVHPVYIPGWETIDCTSFKVMSQSFGEGILIIACSKSSGVVQGFLLFVKCLLEYTTP